MHFVGLDVHVVYCRKFLSSEARIYGANWPTSFFFLFWRAARSGDQDQKTRMCNAMTVFITDLGDSNSTIIHTTQINKAQNISKAYLTGCSGGWCRTGSREAGYPVAGIGCEDGDILIDRYEKL